MKITKEKILIVEDEAITRNNLEHILTKEGYDIHTAEDGKKALEMIKSDNFCLIITDYKMKGLDGMQLLKACKEVHPFTEVIMITGYATVDLAVKAMKDGAYFYIAKPFKIDQVRAIAREALIKRKLRMENIELKNELNKKNNQVPLLIGKSDVMRRVKETIRQVAESNSNVMIIGESGTGKELAAKSIHSLSSRSNKRFVAFNCGAFTEELMANELFGHEKDAYTGATSAKPGLFESANNGTVFLDEISDMPLTMQVKLLRVIQEKEVLRVGGTTPIPIDVRFIAATHRDLSKDIEKGLFRQDLYYRLNVISIHLPPLVEREGDISLLAMHFFNEKIKAASRENLELDDEVLSLLSSHSWPGNVRELENVIERAVALSKGPVIGPNDLPDYFNTLTIETYRMDQSHIPTFEEQEKRYIKWVIEKCQGNKSKASKLMGIDRVSLWRKLKRYHIDS